MLFFILKLDDDVDDDVVCSQVKESTGEPPKEPDAKPLITQPHAKTALIVVDFIGKVNRARKTKVNLENKLTVDKQTDIKAKYEQEKGDLVIDEMVAENTDKHPPVSSRNQK